MLNFVDGPALGVGLGGGGREGDGVGGGVAVEVGAAWVVVAEGLRAVPLLKATAPPAKP